MTYTPPPPGPSPFTIPKQAPLNRANAPDFEHAITRVTKQADTLRMAHMNQYQLCKNTGFVITLLAIIGGASAFAWFLLFEASLIKALACVIITLTIPALVKQWVRKPLEAYLSDYKSTIMPQFAQLMGGFEYHPHRGISEQVIMKTGLTPAYKDYHSEDCFRGHYKGTKVLLSEVRLSGDKKAELFKGLFVLIELPSKLFSGTTILTANEALIAHNETTRWAKMTTPTPANPMLGRFSLYTSSPDDASLLIGDSLIKEVTEADAIFDDAGLSMSFIKGKYIFITIPHQDNMFEACDVHMPINNKAQATKFRQEIQKLLEIIDVIDLYTTQSSLST